MSGGFGFGFFNRRVPSRVEARCVNRDRGFVRPRFEPNDLSQRKGNNPSHRPRSNGARRDRRRGTPPRASARADRAPSRRGERSRRRARGGREKRGSGATEASRCATRSMTYLDLFRERLDLRLGVAHADEVAIRHEIQRVARRADLLVHLMPAADGRVIVRVEHPLVRPRHLRRVQAVLRLVRHRDGGEAEQRRGRGRHGCESGGRARGGGGGVRARGGARGARRERRRES